MTKVNPINPEGLARGNASWARRVWKLVADFPPREGSGPDNGRYRYNACVKCANSVGILNLSANTLLMVIKGYLGIIGRSTALVADAIHSGADVVSAAMLMLGLRIAKKPADGKYPYGYGKVELIVAVLIYVSLIGAGMVIFYDAIVTIVQKKDVNPDGVTMWGALISIVVNEMMFRQSYCAGTQVRSPSMMANAWEKRSDALSSVAVLVGIAGAKMGWHVLDPAAAILVAFYIVKGSVEMIWEAFKGLTDTALEPEVIARICSLAQSVEGVRGVLAARTREIGQAVWIDLDVMVDGECRVGEMEQIKETVGQVVLKGIGRMGNIVVYLKPVSS